jgi:hypothetical protein
MKKSYEINVKNKIKELNKRKEEIRIGFLFSRVSCGKNETINAMDLIAKSIYDKNATIKLVIECEEEILDEIEKRYLENILKPFKNRNIKIKKCECFSSEYLYIYTDDYSSEMSFPEFDKGTMYKGMKKDYEYTIEELNLFQKRVDK